MEYMESMGVEDIESIMEYLRLPFFDDTELEEIVVSGGEALLPLSLSCSMYSVKCLRSSLVQRLRMSDLVKRIRKSGICVENDSRGRELLNQKDWRALSDEEIAYLHRLSEVNLE